MKISILLFIFAVALSISAQNQQSAGGDPGSSQTPGSPSNSLGTSSLEVSPYAVAERGPHHRVWQKVTSQTNSLGETIYRTNSYTELATGMCFWNGNAWTESSAQIQITDNGGVATNTRHHTSFAANLNTAGSIDLSLPSGSHLRSQIVGLAYFDESTSNSVMFAETKDSTGQLLPSGNQVIYSNAFTGFQATVRYTHRRNGFEQDVILESRPPSPAVYGLNPETTRIQIWTEFLNPPEPAISTRPMAAPLVSVEGGGQRTIADQRISFEGMEIVKGRAFLIEGSTKELDAIPVSKEWVHTEGRTFLVEQIFLKSVAKQIQDLPPAPTNGPGGSRSPGASLRLKLPAPKLQAKVNRPLRLASYDITPPAGLVLDYNTVLSDLTNYTFQGDSTYYVSDEVDCYGTNTIEGGAVIKCGDPASSVVVYDTLVCKTAPYRPAIFTCTNDDTVGEVISGSSGNPTNVTITTDLYLPNGGGAISNLFFRYTWSAFTSDNPDVQIWDCQFTKCSHAISVSYSTTNLASHNVLITMDHTINNPTNYCGCLSAAFSIYSTAIHVSGEHITADLDSQPFIVYYVYDPSYTNATCFNFTNCILFTPNLNPLYQYGSPPTMTVGTNTTVYASSAPAYFFQTAGAGSHYLADYSPYRDCGNTNVSAGVLADLKTKTTYPPVILSNVLNSADVILSPQAQRDVSGSPDLGYHYCPLDFILDNYAMTNATLVITNGVAIGFYNDSAGIWLQDGSAIIAIGTPLTPNWFVQYSAVQEQPVAIGTNGPGGGGLMVNPYHFGSTGPNGTFRFSKFSCLGSTVQYIFYDFNSFEFNNLSVQDSELWSGVNWFGGSTTTSCSIDNCLFHRSAPVTTLAAGGTVGFSNNLVLGATFAFRASGGTSYVFNNDFDTCHFTSLNNTATSNNAYLNCINRLNPTNAFDIVSSNSLAYQSGPLGDYYQPTNSSLINEGSTTADLVGLFHYTTQTNQIKETDSLVDIGYHYVAVNTNGVPFDTDGDGLPDYFEDTNGNGSYDSTIDLSNWNSSDTDGDGVSDYIEWLQGRNPRISGANADTNGVINLKVYTPLK